MAVVVALGLPTVSLAQGSESPDTPWEEIRPDFSNVRGLNYIASYAPSDVAMWRFYDHDQIDRELGYVKGLGANSVRVWLAWAVFDAEGDRFIEKLVDFLSLGEQHRITVMPILWDSCFGDARAGYDDVTDWVANPGTDRVADPDFRARGDRYVRAVVEAGRNSPSLLMWDVMNEPSGPKVNPWLEHYCRLVKSLDPDHPVTIGWAHAAGNAVSAQWVDVMSYHPYGIFDKNRQVWTDTVRKIARRHGNKPILVTEAGGPGFGQRYEECLAYFEKEAVGFYLFEAMVGTNRFRRITGFVFPDGSARELVAVKAFQECARRQGIPVDSQYEQRPGGLPYLKSGAKEVADLILNWDGAELTPENLAGRQGLLRWTLISLAWGGALGEHLDEAQKLNAQAEAAQKEGDVDALKDALSGLAHLAARLLIQHGFVREDGDFSWMHGANYTPSYAATDVETWLNYDPALVDRELAYAERIGLNCVRVFLQSLVYEHGPREFLDNFADFVASADRHGLKVMPILFDSCFGVSPSLESRHMWVANPGPDRMSEADFEALDAYVRAVVTPYVGDERIALWDVMNEPTVTVLSLTEEGKAQIWAFVRHYGRLVHQLDPTHAITVGVASSDNSQVVDVVDVLSCHSYAPTREKFREALGTTQSQARQAGKPWIISECCAPGWGNPYEMVMPELREFGVGHTVWEVMIGKNQFAPISGLFYPDGTVRRLSSVEAVAGRAVSGLTEKPEHEGIPIARQRAGRLAEYVRFMARDQVTESTWPERNTAVAALIVHGVYHPQAADVLKKLEEARAAHEAGRCDAAYRTVEQLLGRGADVLTKREKAQEEAGEGA